MTYVIHLKCSRICKFLFIIVIWKREATSYENLFIYYPRAIVMHNAPIAMIARTVGDQV